MGDDPGRSPLTRIFAGAGSGKSTTLLLRVVFMLCHLGIEPGRLTVISFTNASCGQLREQLLRVLAFWQFPFDERQARQCVRTFHSAMAQLAREVLGTARWFEQLDDKAAAGDEPDNPLANARLRPAQQRLLKQAYQRCYAEQPDFREQVHRLLDLPGRRSSLPRAGVPRQRRRRSPSAWPASSRHCRCTRRFTCRPDSSRALACASIACSRPNSNAHPVSASSSGH